MKISRNGNKWSNNFVCCLNFTRMDKHNDLCMFVFSLCSREQQHETKRNEHIMFKGFFLFFFFFKIVAVIIPFFFLFSSCAFSTSLYSIWNKHSLSANFVFCVFCFSFPNYYYCALLFFFFFLPFMLWL